MAVDFDFLEYSMAVDFDFLEYSMVDDFDLFSMSYSSDSSEEDETSYATSDEGEDETDDSETDSTSSSWSFLSDSSETDTCEADSDSDSSYFSIDISHPPDEIQSPDQGLLENPVEEAARIIENRSLNNKFIGSTAWTKCCHDLFASDMGKSIPCSCKKPQSNQDSEELIHSTSGSQSTWDYEEWICSTKNDPIRKNEANNDALNLCNRVILPIGSSRPNISRTRAPSPVNHILHQNSPVSIEYVHFEHNPETTEMWIINLNHQSELITDHHWCTSSEEKTITGTSECIMVEKITIDNKKLHEAACYPEGSRKLLRLIRQLKGSKLAILLTHSLSYGCYMMMLNYFGWRVIKQCFDVFDCSANEVLYEGVITRFLDLATDKRGCIALNECIDAMKGPHRDMLLDAISKDSLYLSDNIYGNFVIQHVLKLEDPRFCNKICGLLSGNYARLSRYENGSHVVKQCLKKSKSGFYYLMDEIRDEPDKLHNLAKDVNGNHVIQQALLISEVTNSMYHYYLLNRLIPLVPILENSKYGKKLAILVQDIARKQKLYSLFPSA